MAEFNSLRTAAVYAGVTFQTIRTWSREYGIGRLEDGKWRIDKEKLDRVVAARQHVAEIEASLRRAG